MKTAKLISFKRIISTTGRPDSVFEAFVFYAVVVGLETRTGVAAFDSAESAS